MSNFPGSVQPISCIWEVKTEMRRTCIQNNPVSTDICLEKYGLRLTEETRSSEYGCSPLYAEKYPDNLTVDSDPQRTPCRVIAERTDFDFASKSIAERPEQPASTLLLTLTIFQSNRSANSAGVDTASALSFRKD